MGQLGQMQQAARSCKQNILEGSRASGTSKETEIKLTNVARASLEELLEDYRDFIRLRGIAEWARDPFGHSFFPGVSGFKISESKSGLAGSRSRWGYFSPSW